MSDMVFPIYGVYRDYKVNRLEKDARRPQDCPIETIKSDSFEEQRMLGVGKQFPEYRLSAVVSTEQSKAFQTIDGSTHAGKWRVVFFWPMDFTFVCPTEIAAFGKLDKE